MSSMAMSKIRRAVAILEQADRDNTWPAMTTDPEVNFYVDQLVYGWGRFTKKKLLW